MWHEEQLCGLASGRISPSKAVRLDWIERFPGDNPLRGHVIPTALTCADAYRILIGSSELRLYDVADHLIPVYREFGFQLVPQSGNAQVMRRIEK